MTASPFLEARTARIEWPTIGLIVVCYCCASFLVWNHMLLPWWLLPVGAYFVALHVSLQHEVLHGHPTRKRWLNELLVFVTLSFWMPYGRYRDDHLKHHNDLDLTDPVRDPESYYLLPESWAAAGPVKRLVYSVNQTLAGRMLLGPAISIITFWSADLMAVARGDRKRLKEWVLFGVSCGIAAVLISAVAGLALWKYYVLIAYPGIGLSLVRSYCEHQAAENVGHRTIIVEASPFWSLLFLNNNLHVAHHSKPALPWYRLPAYYRAERVAMLARNNGYVMRGYGEIFRRFLFTAKEPIAYPDTSWLRPGGSDQ